MSEDEIIEHIEYSLLNSCFNNENSTIINNEDLKGLLDLYQQEKEKNKMLDEKLKMSIAMLTKGTYPETEKGANNFDNYFISKDKIKAKIEELEKLIETNSLYEECWNKIDVLLELLEEK